MVTLLSVSNNTRQNFEMLQDMLVEVNQNSYHYGTLYMYIKKFPKF